MPQRPSFRYKRKYEASPFFQKTNSSAIAANQYWYFNFDEDGEASKRYIPFNLMLVTNASNYAIRLYINQTDRYQLIPANSTKAFDRTSVPVLHSGKVYNTDSSNEIAANLISVEVQREQYDTSNVIASLHKALRGF
ncbi:MAG: hypothetical protein ACYS6W_14635 [Planctomycetota bacterium]|jgi:hypothetical protein